MTWSKERRIERLRNLLMRAEHERTLKGWRGGQRAHAVAFENVLTWKKELTQLSKRAANG